MKILHYALGFPPYRTGGLTKFNMDLMCQQYKMGNTVALIWPGKLRIVDKKVSIKKRKEVVVDGATIGNFEIINPLPVSYDEGISEFTEFIKNTDEKIYVNLLDDFNPDVIHVHTLMGMHKAFLEAAKKKGIRLVFTTHDFFPICPKVTMLRAGEVCMSASTCDDCGTCNASALSIKKIKILQSSTYRLIKDSGIVKKMRKRHRDAYLSGETVTKSLQSVGTAEQFLKLRQHYYSLLQMMDVIHYNSTVTKSIYDQYFELPNNCVISISHSDIADHRIKKDFNSAVLRVRYLGSASEAKGFFVLKKACEQVWENRQNFQLDVHFKYSESIPYMKCNERYRYDELKEIFAETDVLIAPSIWYETFGYTVLEALSFGVPVIISGTVGAKDILADGAGIVIDQISAEKLSNVLLTLDVPKLQQMNQVILDKQEIMTIEKMAWQIEKRCYC